MISPRTTFDQIAAGIAATTTIELDLRGFVACDVLVHHVITSGTAYVSAAYRSAPDAAPGTPVSVPHHGAGVNIKSSAQATSYTTRFDDCQGVMALTVTVASGASDLYVTVLRRG